MKSHFHFYSYTFILITLYCTNIPIANSQNTPYQTNNRLLYDLDFKINNITGTGDVVTDETYRASCLLLNCESGCCEGSQSEIKCGIKDNCIFYQNHVDKWKTLKIVFGIIAGVVGLAIIIILILVFTKNKTQSNPKTTCKGDNNCNTGSYEDNGGSNNTKNNNENNNENNKNIDNDNKCLHTKQPDDIEPLEFFPNMCQTGRSELSSKICPQLMQPEFIVPLESLEKLNHTAISEDSDNFCPMRKQPKYMDPLEYFPKVNETAKSDLSSNYDTGTIDEKQIEIQGINIKEKRGIFN